MFVLIESHTGVAIPRLGEKQLLCKHAPPPTSPSILHGFQIKQSELFIRFPLISLQRMLNVFVCNMFLTFMSRQNQLYSESSIV